MGRGRNGGAAGGSGRQRAAPSREFPETPWAQEDWNGNVEYTDFLNAQYNAQKERDTEYLSSTIFQYENDATSMNNYLRGTRDNLWAMQKSWIPQLDSLMHPITEGVTVYRGADIPDIGRLARAGTLVGATIDDKGFMSTSINKGVAEYFVERADSAKSLAVVKIRIPKGKKVIYTDPNGMFKSQREIIIERGSRIKVTGYKVRPDGVYEVEADIVEG